MDMSMLNGGSVDQNIERLMKAQGVPRQQVIDPVTPILLENLVKRAQEFSLLLVNHVFDEEDFPTMDLFDLCFSALRPLPANTLSLDAIRNIFFNIYFVNHGAVFDYVLAHYDEDPKYSVSEKGIKAFSTAYNKLTEGIYNHFVRDKRASYSFFETLLDEFTKAIRD